jgi:hypothetical protein
MAGVISISGGFVQITLHHYTGVDLPWIIWTLLLTGLAVALMLRGVVVSTKWAGYFFGAEMLVLAVVSVATLLEHRGELSFDPFLPSHISDGFKGLAAGFPLAVYLFIGWENSAALAEETENPACPRPRRRFRPPCRSLPRGGSSLSCLHVAAHRATSHRSVRTEDPHDAPTDRDVLLGASDARGLLPSGDRPGHPGQDRHRGAGRRGHNDCGQGVPGRHAQVVARVRYEATVLVAASTSGWDQHFRSRP